VTATRRSDSTATQSSLELARLDLDEISSSDASVNSTRSGSSSFTALALNKPCSSSAGRSSKGQRQLPTATTH